MDIFVLAVDNHPNFVSRFWQAIPHQYTLVECNNNLGPLSSISFSILHLSRTLFLAVNMIDRYPVPLMHPIKNDLSVVQDQISGVFCVLSTEGMS